RSLSSKCELLGNITYALEREILTTPHISFEQLSLSTLVCIPVHTAGALFAACRETEGRILIRERRMLPDPSGPGRRPDGDRSLSIGGKEYSLGNRRKALHGSALHFCWEMGI